MPKQFLNSVQASFSYKAKLIKWNEKAVSRTDCKRSQLPEQDIQSDPLFWYCQTKYIESESRCILDFLDPEHLLTNTGSKVCTTGFQAAGISSKARLKTFSPKVESAMASYGYKEEANFCALIRNWYRAQDEGGISSTERRSYERDLREWLMKGVRFDIFPPPGKYVKDIPITHFEGLRFLHP